MANAAIRQPINILDSILSAASGASATSNEMARLDTAQFTGPTFYFEVIAQSTVSLAFTVTLVGSVDGTIATINVPTLTTAYTRLRSSSFSPTTQNQTVTVVISNAVGATKNVKFAQILVLQSAATIDVTETQIEIGNADNTISLTDVPLTNPKYWTYTASKWSPTPAAYFEATFKSGTTKSKSTITLQVDDGAFGGWANVSETAIVTTTTTNPELIRSGAFALTDGRHYRVVMKAGNTKSGLTLYNAKVILQHTSWSLVGSGLTIAGTGAPALAALSSTRVAFFDATLESLRAYDFNGSTWSLVGSGLTITGAGSPALAAMSATRVAYFDDNLDSLRAYDFDGSNWSLVGSGLTLTSQFLDITALSSTRIAAVDAPGDVLRAYDFNGSTWSQVGSDFTITGVGGAGLATLTSSRIALIDTDLELLTAYDFNGSTWSQVGNSLSITGLEGPQLAALSSTRVAFFDSTPEDLRVYDFDGTNWSLVNAGFRILGAGSSAIAAMSATRVAYFDDVLESLRAYDFSVITVQALEPQYLVMNTQEAGTGLQAFPTLWDATEWNDTQGGLPTFTYSHDASNAADSSKLRDITAGADVSGATVTGANQQISAAFTMPTTGDELDTNVTVSTGVVAAVRILAAWVKVTPADTGEWRGCFPPAKRVIDEHLGYSL
jgi:hypothetical protein